MLDNRTWAWLTNPKIQTLGLWVFFEHNQQVINEIKERINAIKDRNDFIKTTAVLINKLRSIKQDPFFSVKCSAKMVDETLQELDTLSLD
ncbi:MAG TPA: hypothetical protein GX699_05645 [Firmicutes bacterium]|nr:hypothetical protein [Bacillota bacterium]